MADALSEASDDVLMAPMCSIFRRFLKRQGLKFTTERALILNAVLEKEGVFEADQLLMEMRDHHTRVSKATIYRTLKHLLQAGIISEVLLDSRQAHYQLSYGRQPKGHLVCVETQRVIEFAIPADLVALRDKVARQHRFEPVSARFVVYGISPEAQRDAQAEVADSD